mmetsp:Transcript_94280/g.270015  ORF Transcript_94280/g.270015 Transcript_94280/m.270015 type:complete len:136 (-) Transcript_94280:247-654(-)
MTPFLSEPVTNGVELTGFGIVVLALFFYLSIGKKMGTRRDRPKFNPRAGGGGGVQSSYEMVPVGDEDEARDEARDDEEGGGEEEDHKQERFGFGAEDEDDEPALSLDPGEGRGQEMGKVPEELRGIFWSGPSEGR